jgi:hypothetical protein
MCSYCFIWLRGPTECITKKVAKNCIKRSTDRFVWTYVLTWLVKAPHVNCQFNALCRQLWFCITMHSVSPSIICPQPIIMFLLVFSRQLLDEAGYFRLYNLLVHEGTNMSRGKISHKSSRIFFLTLTEFLITAWSHSDIILWDCMEHKCIYSVQSLWAIFMK